MTDRTFVQDKDFDAQAYFSNYYGIMQGGNEPKQRIALKIRRMHLKAAEE